MNQDDAFAAAAIDILKARWPTVWQEMAQVPLYTDVQMKQDRPEPTLIAGGLQLASAHDPVAEAKLQIGRIPEGASELWLYGVGMGYVPRLLLPELGPAVRLNVVPLNRGLFRELLYWVDQSDWLADERVRLHLANAASRPQSPYVVTPPCLWLADEPAEALRDRLQMDLNQDAIEHNLRLQQEVIDRNLAANGPSLASDGDVGELFGQMTDPDAAAVVVGAGPSLDGQTEDIKRLQDGGARVICVDAALRPLLAMGIRPDLIVVYDHKDAVRTLFDTDLSGLKETRLVYFPAVDPGVLAAWPHARLVAYSHEEIYQSLKQRHPRRVLFTSGSVVHPAVDLAVKMGARRLYLAGADFAFPQEQTHAQGVPSDTRGEVTAEGATRQVTSGDGGRVTSSPNLIAYLRDLEDYIRLQPGVRFVNLGRQGARITGAEHPEVSA